jgi:hypothetical protein
MRHNDEREREREDMVGRDDSERRYTLREKTEMFINSYIIWDITPGRLCGLVVRVLGYRSGGSGSIPGTTRKKNSGSGTGSTQPREYN